MRAWFVLASLAGARAVERTRARGEQTRRELQALHHELDLLALDAQSDAQRGEGAALERKMDGFQRTATRVGSVGPVGPVGRPTLESPWLYQVVYPKGVAYRSEPNEQSRISSGYGPQFPFPGYQRLVLAVDKEESDGTTYIQAAEWDPEGDPEGRLVAKGWLPVLNPGHVAGVTGKEVLRYLGPRSSNMPIVDFKSRLKPGQIMVMEFRGRVNSAFWAATSPPTSSSTRGWWCSTIPKSTATLMVYTAGKRSAPSRPPPPSG